MAAKKVIQSEFAQPERLSRSSNYDVIFHFKGVGVSTASLKTAWLAIIDDLIAIPLVISNMLCFVYVDFPVVSRSPQYV